MMSLQAEDGPRRPSLLGGMRSRSSSTTSPSKSVEPGVDLNGEDPLAAFEALQLERKKGEWASWAESEFQKCKSSREPFERQWYINLAFYLGKQYLSPVQVPGQGFRLTTPRAPSHRVRLVVNKVRTAVRTECAKLTTNRPIPVVTPATNEEEDYSAARVAELLVQNQFGNAEFESQYRNAIFWASVAGNGFMKNYWNPTGEDRISLEEETPVGPDGMPLLDDEGNPDRPKLKPATGRIEIKKITPFHIYVPDLLSEDINDQPYLIHCMTQSVEWVKKNFGITATPDAKTTNSLLDASFLVTKGREHIFDAVMVKEMWIKPGTHVDFPDGGLLTVVNGKVVQHRTEWPVPFRDYPFHKIDSLPTGGFYSDSIIVDLIPLQKEYNRTKSQMIEIKNQMGKPKFLYPRGSINIRQVNTEAGQGIPYIQGYEKPTVLPGVEVPMSMSNELDRLTIDFDDISGQHEIARGGTPNAAISSGTAISFLQEQDDLKLGYQVASIEKCMEAIGTQVLLYISTYWTQERIIRITGKDNAFESMVWKGSSLRGNHDVKIQTGSALPYSKAAKTAMITEFMQNGWLPPEIGMDILNMGGFDKALNEILVDKRQVQRENLKLAKMDLEAIIPMIKPPEDPNTGEPLIDEETGQPMNLDGSPWTPQSPLPVNSWDNHEVHIQLHNNYRKTQDFEMLDDYHKEAFELHVQTHQMAIQGAPMEGQMGPLPNGMSPEMAEQAMQQEEGQPSPEELEQAQLETEQAMNEGQLDQLRKQERHELEMDMKSREQRLKEAALVKRLGETGPDVNPSSP